MLLPILTHYEPVNHMQHLPLSDYLLDPVCLTGPLDLLMQRKINTVFNNIKSKASYYSSCLYKASADNTVYAGAYTDEKKMLPFAFPIFHICSLPGSCGGVFLQSRDAEILTGKENR